MPLDRLAAAGDPQLRRILLYARGRRDPFTAAEAAEAFEIHRNVVRGRLDRLVDSGFLVVAFERRGTRRGPGAGRPAKVYSVAPELEGVEFPDRRLVELIRLLVKGMPAEDRSHALRAAGEEYGRELATAVSLRPARRLATGLERVCDALGTLGFHAAVVSVAGERAELASATCPLRPLVVRCPDAGGIDCGMWAGLLEAGVQGVRAASVSCETPRCLSTDAACSVLLTLGPDAIESPASAGH